MGPLDRLSAEWSHISEAPISFLIVSGVIAGVVWVVLNWRYGGIIEGLKERLLVRDERLNEYQRKLEGATPDEVRARIDELERRILASKGRTLATEQAQTLTQAFQQVGITEARVNWFGSGGEERRYATQIAEAIEAAGISVQMSASTVFMNYAVGVILFEDDNGDHLIAAKIFNEIGIPYSVSQREGRSTPHLFILVGERDDP